jgi:cytoskeletal protein CcmA (bactofilin family)
MVFRRDNKSGDAFQRQMSALRQQLGGEEGEATDEQQANHGEYSSGDAGSFSGGLSESMARASNYQEYPENFDGQAGDEGVTGAVSPTAPVIPELPEVDAQTTVIAQDATWKGDISSEGTVHVHGRFEGAIRARNDVFVAGGSDVNATISATNVIVAGLLKGTVRSSARFEVLPTGRVTGDVQAPTLVVHEGAIVAGQLRMGVGEPVSSESKPTSVIQRRATRGTA